MQLVGDTPRPQGREALVPIHPLSESNTLLSNARHPHPSHPLSDSLGILPSTSRIQQSKPPFSIHPLSESNPLLISVDRPAPREAPIPIETPATTTEKSRSQQDKISGPIHPLSESASLLSGSPPQNACLPKGSCTPKVSEGLYPIHPLSQSATILSKMDSQVGTTPSKPTMSAAQKLRSMLADPDKIIVAPGVYDGISARVALREGFDCLYMTGAGTTMSRLGMPDLGVATLNDMRDNASMIAGLDRNVPLIADADTGYGGPLMVGRTVAQYMAAGIAALHLEDQIVTKRCGHLRNKELVDAATFHSRIRAAVQMRAQTIGDIVIIARTDALQSLGYEEAISRLKKAIEIGADVAFLEGVTSTEQARKACAELAPTPCLLNMVDGGSTPSINVSEAKKLGYRIIIFPGFALNAITAVTKLAKQLKETGSIVGKDTPYMSPKELFEMVGLNQAIEFDIAAGGTSYSTGL